MKRPSELPVKGKDVTTNSVESFPPFHFGSSGFYRLKSWEREGESESFIFYLTEMEGCIEHGACENVVSSKEALFRLLNLLLMPSKHVNSSWTFTYHRVKNINALRVCFQWSKDEKRQKKAILFRCHHKD